MRLPRIAICVLTLTLLAANARSELSARLPLPKQLAVETLPPFSAKGQDADQMFQKRHLEKMIAQDPKITRVALVYFATWCAPCALGALKLKAAREALKRNGVLAVFVNVGETDVTAVHKWIKEYGDLGFPLIMDTKSQMVGPYGLTDPSGRVLMPRTIVLNRNLKPLFLLGTEGDDFPEILWRP
ncbi:MAG: TlpA family protein disulfide reductase [Chitinispirillales bacterium]|jgi:peroxiredoxin|nr:TlpA family protein disulfide reductase [Chitinispirillales bacterium]